ncbi:MAG: CPBP family intramembrane metalloprotease [Clostridiales bacterium]|nr:CPBP family intramembrane metalloprotease [Clostridiales bacterium]
MREEINLGNKRRNIDLFDGGTAYLIASAGLCILQFLLEWLSGTGLFNMGAVKNIASSSYYVLCLGLPAAYLAGRRKYPLESLRLLPISPGRAIGIVVLAAFAFMVVSIVSMFWSALVEATGGVIYDTSVALPTDTMGIIGMFMLMVAFPAIFEELAFRGVILNSLESRGKVRAAAITTMLFTLIHGSLLGFPSEIIGGALMAMLVFRLGSLYASMIYHTAFNGIAFAVMLWAGDAPAQTGTVLEQVGGMQGLLGMLPGLVIFTLLMIFQYRLCVRATRPVSADHPRKNDPMDWQTLLVWLGGIFTGIYFLIQDLILIYGG